MAIRLFGIVILLNLLICTPWAAEAKNKIALVVGNKNYSQQVGPLSNPLNDAKLVSDALAEIGFQVDVVRDGDRVTILRKISDFAKALGRAGPGAIGFFYYSGHGVSRPESQANYLIPVDVHDINDPNIWWNAVPLDAVIDELQRNAPDAARFLVFDACRNELRVASKGATNKSFVPIFAQGGTFIATSTGPNRTATDDPGQTSGPYARALALELPKQGQDHLTLFQNVKSRVFSTTNPAQLPWEINGLVSRVYLNSQTLDARQPSSINDAGGSRTGSEANAAHGDLLRKVNDELIKLTGLALGEKLPEVTQQGLMTIDLDAISGTFVQTKFERETTMIDVSIWALTDSTKVLKAIVFEAEDRPAKARKVRMAFQRFADIFALPFYFRSRSKEDGSRIVTTPVLKIGSIETQYTLHVKLLPDTQPALSPDELLEMKAKDPYWWRREVQSRETFTIAIP